MQRARSIAITILLSRSTQFRALPVHAFQRVSADIFLYVGVNYLLVVDVYSKWPCAVPLRSLSSSSTIAEMERIFNDFGTLEVVMSDI